MSNWIHALPLWLMAVVIFGGAYLVTAIIYRVVLALAVGDRARAFKGVSPGLLSPLGIVAGLLVAFLAAQAWGDVDRAQSAVNREAGALRAVVILPQSFPGETGARLRALVRQHIQAAVTQEWPAMADRRETLTMIPTALAQALQTTLATPTQGEGQLAAQRGIVASIDAALDARRQRVLASQLEVTSVKWVSLLIQAICTLAAIAMVHSDNRASAALAMGLFSTAMAVCILLIAAHDRPFTGQSAVQPTTLLQVQPDATETVQ